MAFAPIYGLGAAMGWTPQQVGDCSLWEFQAGLAGWLRANGSEDKPTAPTDEEHDDLVAKYSDV
jgi:hypothetical protein